MKRLPNDMERDEGVLTVTRIDESVRPQRRPGAGPNGGSRIQRPPAGLCVTCIHMEGCALRFATEGAVLMCEEFDDRIPVTAEKAPSEPVAERPVHTAPALASGLSALKGLCIDCEDRSTCRLPRSAEGVWHCEEYR